MNESKRMQSPNRSQLQPASHDNLTVYTLTSNYILCSRAATVPLHHVDAALIPTSLILKHTWIARAVALLNKRMSHQYSGEEKLFFNII